MPVDLAVILVYLAATLAFGAWVARGQQDVKDYFISGRTIPWWAITGSIVATETSTVTFISVPGYAFTGNFTFLQLVFGYLIGRVVVSALFVPAYFRGELLSVYQLLGQRFGTALKRLASGLFLVTRSLSDGFRLFATGLVLAALPPGAEEGTRQQSWALAFADALERDGLDAAGGRFAWGAESGLDAKAAGLVKLGFAEHAPHALAHTLRELLAVQPGAEALAAKLAPLAAPILLLVGERDPVSLGPMQRLAAALPRAELVVVPGAGHAVNLEARDATSAALETFLVSRVSG